MSDQEKNYSRIYADNPIAKAKEFDFEAYAKTLADIILYKENETPITIGIHGEWGSGKTSLMKSIKEKLENSSVNENTRKCKCIWFNVWKYADEESILTAIINRILEQIENDKNGYYLLKEIKKVRQKVKDMDVLNIDSISIAGVGGVKWKTDEFLSYDEFQKKLNDILEEYITGKSNRDGVIDDKKGVLVIFIDDLDRCHPDKVLKVIETIKLFLDQRGCIFVIGADMKIVSNIISKFYGETKGFDGKQFMEKVIQLPFNLPPISGTNIKGFIESLNVNGIVKDYINIISGGIKSNPRRVKRFINLFELQRSLADNKGILGKNKGLEEELLTKWCVLEFEFPDFIDEVRLNPELLILMQKISRSEDRDKVIRELDDKDRKSYEKYFKERGIMNVLKCGEKEFIKGLVKNYIYQTREVALVKIGEVFDDSLIFGGSYYKFLPNIGIIGVGGAGSNMVSRIGETRIDCANLYAINTAVKDMRKIGKNVKKGLIGANITRGLSACGDYEIGREAALRGRDNISQMIQNTNLLFILAGMGGGTGTGAAPVVAEIAKGFEECTTVAVVTFPFEYEGAQRIASAKKGIYELRKHVDTVVIFDNNRLAAIYKPGSLNEALKKADEIITTEITKLITGISETISTQQTSVNEIALDYSDIRTIMKVGGKKKNVAVMCLGNGESIEEAIENTIKTSPVDVDYEGATGVLIHVIGGLNMKLVDTAELSRQLTDSLKLDPQANIIWGIRVKEDLVDNIEVITIFNGVKCSQITGNE